MRSIPIISLRSTPMTSPMISSPSMPMTGQTLPFNTRTNQSPGHNNLQLFGQPWDDFQGVQEYDPNKPFLSTLYEDEDGKNDYNSDEELNRYLEELSDDNSPEKSSKYSL